MASQILYLKGSSLWRQHPSSLVYQKVGQMRIVPVATFNLEEADGTNHDSEGGFEETIPTIKRNNAANGTLVFHPDIAMHGTIWDDFVNNVETSWRAYFPDGVRGFEYLARVTTFGFGGGGLAYTDIATMEFALKTRGLPSKLGW